MKKIIIGGLSIIAAIVLFFMDETTGANMFSFYIPIVAHISAVGLGIFGLILVLQGLQKR